MKKLLCIVMAVITVMAVSSSAIAKKLDESSAPDGFGDVNGDLMTNNKDLKTLFLYVSENEDFDPNCDINGDKSVNNKDVAILFRFLSGYEIDVADDFTVPATFFTVSHAFDDGMVLQRNEPIRIWGFADLEEEGKAVYAEFDGLTGSTTVHDGHWMITLDGTLPENTEGKTLRVYGSKASDYKFEDVLVGDVYYAIGQSNMHYSVQDVRDEPLSSQAGKDVPISNDLQIRLNRNYFKDNDSPLQRGTTEVNEDAVQKRGWEYPEEGAPAFSALAYFSAYQIYETLERKVPIGLIEFDGNGLALHAFLPNEVADALSVDAADGSGVYYAPGSNPHASRFVYNHYMYAFRYMPICGIMWYQGESDNGYENQNNTKYAERFTALIEYMRNTHDLINHDYPVYIMEFPTLYTGTYDFSVVRATICSIPNMLTNAHICGSSDVWKNTTYTNNIHPYIKYEQSVRLASIILADKYGVGNIEDKESPTAVSCELSGDKLTATVKLRNVGGGLKFTGDALKGIKIKTAGSDTWIEPLSAEITGTDTIVITAEAVITAVGYNTSVRDCYPETLTLCSGTDVPCASFEFFY